MHVFSGKVACLIFLLDSSGVASTYEISVLCFEAEAANSPVIPLFLDSSAANEDIISYGIAPFATDDKNRSVSCLTLSLDRHSSPGKFVSCWMLAVCCGVWAQQVDANNSRVGRIFIVFVFPNHFHGIV